jgi:uncharacterized membrane protein YgcG/BMFP domain-containing protein YqiC
MPRTARRALAVTSALLALAVVAGPAPAVAEAPVDVAGPVTDRADALGAELPRVREALNDFYRRTGHQLFVVYVRSFDGLTGQEWAARTAERSGLGRADVLLAVALEQRSYGYDADAEEFSEADLERVDREFVLPALREDDWAGAATGAAEGLAEVDEDSGVPWGWVVGGAAVVAGLGAYGVHRARRRYDRTHPVVDEHGDPVDPAALLDDDALEAAAAAALVDVDDAVQASTQELGFAEAQFGAEATATFRRVVEDGRARLREAFALRQRLDDAEPETDAERRTLHSRILQLCREVDDALDAQVEHFDAVRDLQARAPEALAALEPRIAELTTRVPTVATALESLRATHSGSALSAVADNVERAGALLAGAREHAGLARTALGTDDRAAAALHLRTAEDATAQAAALLDAVVAAREDLERVRDAADDLLGQVVATVSAVTTYVETHRAAVGSTARTRLSEAARLLEEGRTTLAADPGAATRALERAAALVKEAQTTAEADVAAWRAGSGRRDDLVLGGILGPDVTGSILSGGWGGFGGSSRRSGSPTWRSSTRRSASTRSTGTRRSGGRTRRSGGGRF